MCGIAGIFQFRNNSPIELKALESMIFPVTHRGPDGYGFFQNERVGMAHARLSIIDLEGGWQPIHNEDKTLWIVFNGEIFNYIELRPELEKRGHKFYTNSDTEVIIHLYEEKGEKCLEDLNGQFAIAIFDTQKESLFLARDRLGIRPLYYTFRDGRFYFTSEIKSIFAADVNIPRVINPHVLAEIFTFWTPGNNETIFEGINQLPPGHWASIHNDGSIRVHEYWDIPFTLSESSIHPGDEYADQLRELLIDSVRLRLRADVPVGAYLSGGIDSSTITSLIHHYTNNPLKTFSVTFADTVYDEQTEQQTMVDYLDTDHNTVHCTYKKIAQAFPDVIWHTETSILRTAPTPLYYLAGLVRQNNYKVVLTGEGADEILGGYDIFKEAKIRAFIRKNPDSSIRPFLLKRLYPYLALSPAKSAEYARKFFATDAPVDSDIFYAHGPRWKTTAGTHIFWSDDLRQKVMEYDAIERLSHKYTKKMGSLDFFTKAQYLETKLLLGNYLLSSQGDRMAMAHSVEGRFPFLDHRVVEFAFSIPPILRMKVLNEKNILKESMKDILPDVIVNRKKQPYMAPDILSFFGEQEPGYLEYYLSESLLNEVGLFKAAAVKQLITKCRKRARQGFRENMAFVGILSTQILYDKFIKNFQVDVPAKLENVKVIS